MVEAAPMLSHYFSLAPWDLDRLTVAQFNAYVQFGNQLMKQGVA